MSFFAARSIVCGLGLVGGVAFSSSTSTAAPTRGYSPFPATSPSPTLKAYEDPSRYPHMWGVGWDPNWDPDYEGTDPEGKTLRQILLIRHGQYHHDEAESAKDGREANRLTPMGFEQAYQTGVYLAEQIEQAAVKTEKMRKLAVAKAELKEFKEKYGHNPAAPALQTKRVELQAALNQANQENAACGSFLLSSNIRTMYVSNMIRAKQTMQSIREGMADTFKRSGKGSTLPPLLIDPTLKERYPCPVTPYNSGIPDEIDPSEMEEAENVFRRYFYRPERVSVETAEKLAQHNKETASQQAPRVSSPKKPAPSSGGWFGRSANTTAAAVPAAVVLPLSPTAEEMGAADHELISRHPCKTQTSDITVDILVMHSNVMRYLILRALQLPPEAWLRLSCPHCSITSLKMLENGRVSMMSYGSGGHLLTHQFTHRNSRPV